MENALGIAPPTASSAMGGLAFSSAGLVLSVLALPEFGEDIRSLPNVIQTANVKFDNRLLID